MTWTATDLRALHAEHLAGAAPTTLAKRYGRPSHNLIVAWAKLGLFRITPARKTRSFSITSERLKAIHGDWMAGESLMSIGRRTGHNAKGLRCAFAVRGLALKPPRDVKPRTQSGTFAATAPMTESEIAAAIARTQKFIIPEELRLHWLGCDIATRSRIIAALRTRHSHPDDRPETPFSANVTPFDYTSPEARKIAAAANAGLPSQQFKIHLKINSQGVIWNGRLFFWVKQSRTYVEGIRWSPENGRPILSRVIWEAASAMPIPAGSVIRLKDENANNLDPANLYLCTRDELSRANQAAHLTRNARALTTAILAAILLSRSADRGLAELTLQAIWLDQTGDIRPTLDLDSSGIDFFRRLQPLRVAKVASFFKLPG